ncbi:MAG: hypothetical protein M3680_16995 [Myxococcota bacterium]|nr:hypothetical protein [Myxococcota bacterium]
MPKTLAEIAIEAGLVNKASAAKAGRMAEEQKLPLVVILVHALKVDEVALIGALRKQTRVPLIDPAEIQIDTEALRCVPRDACARLRVLPLSLTTDGPTKVLRVAMADPTDTSAILELEALTHCEIDVAALPLSAIDELVAKGYRQLTTAIVSRPTGHTTIATAKGAITLYPESETSVTAQIPLAALQALGGPDEVESRFGALIQLLVAKGVITEAEADGLKKPRS